jgi:hypothetical protein
VNISSLHSNLQEALTRGSDSRIHQTISEAQSTAVPALKPGESFRDHLNALQIQKPLTEEEQKERTKKVAGDLVANALILPIMKQIRRSVWAKDSRFTGGIGEKTFGPEFDMQIADRIAHSPRMSVTNSLAQRLMARTGNKTAATQPTATQETGVDLHG